MTRPSEMHLSDRSNWLRAAVLGANDGIVSTASLVLGIAAAGASGTRRNGRDRGSEWRGVLDGCGEYVSVSSQRDSEAADLRLGDPELRAAPEGELRELADIYVRRVCAGIAIVARAAISHSWLSFRGGLGGDDPHGLMGRARLSCCSHEIQPWSPGGSDRS